MGNGSDVGHRPGRELIGWVLVVLGAGALQLPALGRMGMHGVDIMQFEMVRTTSEALRLHAALGADGLAAARQELLLDYGFLVVYGIALWKACRLLGTRALGRRSHLVARLAPAIAWVSVVAAGCDAVENAGLFAVTLGHTRQPWPGLATDFATAKFGLLAVALVFLILAGLATLPARPDREDQRVRQ